MSIAITAPQKFDFQDIVCVEMMLRFHHLNTAQFFAEPKDGEDGEILFGPGMPTEKAEIQVKGAAGAVTIDVIAGCLAHSPPRKVSDTLLERLLGDPTRLVVLVVSGRCDDAASVYSLPFDWTGCIHPDHALKQDDAVTLLGAFANVQVPGKAGSSLKTGRENHFRTVAATTDPSKLRIALQRLIILERLNEVELESRCAERLRTAHRIPSDRIPDVLARLRLAVKTAKIEAIDAFPLIRAGLQKAAPPPTRPQDYVCRGDEKEWVDLLSRENILLLSGPPRVGKTDAARWVAAEFETHGYEIRVTNDVDAAERFLLEPGESLRLVVLDDPLGGSHAAPDATRNLSRIDTLIRSRNLRLNRKLIIAQGQEHLLATSRQNALSDVNTAEHTWRNLGPAPAAFLCGLWEQYAEKWNVTLSLRQFVQEALSRGDLLLEAGCLRHLAVHHARLENRYDLNQIIRLAREEATSLGHALGEEGFEKLLTGLALASSEKEPIALSELSFVIGAGGDGLPGKPKTTAICYGTGCNDPECADDPCYETPPCLGLEDEERLDKLERRQIVEVDAGDRVAFKHPFYRSAAEAMLGNPTRKIAAKIVTVIERGLFCIDPPTSRASARNFNWVYDLLTPQPKAQAELINCAVSGLTSYFPSTRDLCFTFLLRRRSQLPHDKQQELPRWISAVTSVSLESLEWINGDARLPLGKTLNLWGRYFMKTPKEEVAAELLILEDTESEYLSPERAVKVLKFYNNSPGTLNIRAMGRLLSYDEAAIRAKATELWLMVPRIDDDALLQRIFSEDHPSIALAALKGSIKGYNKWTTGRRQAILARLQAFAALPASAAAMLNLLGVFDRAEDTGENPPWEIFEKLLPVIMRVVPVNAVFIDARFFSVADTAQSVIQASSMVAICDGWIDWLERNSTAGRLPSDFSLGVAKILLAATKTEPDLRSGRIKRLLDFPGTGALVSFIADMVDRWDDLTEDERTDVEKLVAGATRSDARWLQAMVLTRTDVPKQLQLRILGDKLSLDSDAKALLNTMEPILLCAAIHVYSGLPQPLWWLGTHHCFKQRWEPVVELIAATPSHPLFDLAWQHITFGGKGKRVAKLINAVGLQHAERMLDLLIRIKVRCSGDFMPDAWAALLGLAPDLETRSRWIKKMSEYAPAILDDLSDLLDWLEDDDIELMLKWLKTDTVPLDLLDMISKASGGEVFDEIQTTTTEFLGAFFEKAPPRLFGTCDQIVAQLKLLQINDQDLSEKIKTRREAIFAEMDSIENDSKLPEEDLEGWIDP